MVKIAYIELDTHAEIAQNFMELMQDSKAFSVDYYFSEKILNQLGLEENDHVKKVNPENLFQQLSINNYQLVIIGTVHRYFNVFEKITEQFNTSIICHNLNFVKASKFDLIRALFKEDFKYRLKLLLKEGLLIKSKVYQKAKHLFVLEQGFQTAQPDKYKFLPIFFTKFLGKTQNNVFTIVIPGSVSQRRRDYEKVIKKLRKFELNANKNELRRSETLVETKQQEKESSVGTTHHLEIILLGKASGKELKMIQDFEQSKSEKISITYFTEKVSQHVFDEFMQKADILWCPIQQETKFFSQKEIYGVTKMSGNIGDAIKYGKLAVFPESYPSNYSFIVHEKEHVEDFIFIKEQVYFSEFSKEKVLQGLEKTIFASLHPSKNQ